MENQLIRGQVFDVLFNYAEKWGSICTESDCATVCDEICLRIDQSQFTADEAEEHINQEVEKRIAERLREELIKYDKYIGNKGWIDNYEDETAIPTVDEYLKSREK